MSKPIIKKKKITLISSDDDTDSVQTSANTIKTTFGTNQQADINHPMYDNFISEYTQNYIVTDQIKTSLTERVKNNKNLTIQDKENIFLLIMTHYNRNPIKESFSDKNDLPYGGKQLKTKVCATFELEKMPDQIIFILHKFLDLIEDDTRSQIDENDLPSMDYDEDMDCEYNNTNIGYAMIS